MTATAKSGKMGLGTKAALLVLALWSLVSLVVIVVWSTSPDLKGSARCREDLRASHEKILGAEALWARDKAELERRLQLGSRRLESAEAELALLAATLASANRTLDACRARQEILLANVSALQEEAELLQQTKLNLTNRLLRQEDLAEELQHNLTQSGHLAAACSSLRAAADNHAAAAQTQTRACQADRDFLQKQLVKCQEAAAAEAPPPPQTHHNPEPTESGSRGLSAAPAAVAVAVAMCGRLLVT